MHRAVPEFSEKMLKHAQQMARELSGSSVTSTLPGSGAGSDVDVQETCDVVDSLPWIDGALNAPPNSLPPSFESVFGTSIGGIEPLSAESLDADAWYAELQRFIAFAQSEQAPQVTEPPLPYLDLASHSPWAPSVTDPPIDISGLSVDPSWMFSAPYPPAYAETSSMWSAAMKMHEFYQYMAKMPSRPWEATRPREDYTSLTHGVPAFPTTPHDHDMFVKFWHSISDMVQQQMREQQKQQQGTMPPPAPPALSAEWQQKKITTVMLRNIPNKYTQQMLLEEMNDAHFGQSFDYLYLPVDAEKNANLGYAFINFINPDIAARFKSAFEGARMRRFNSKKVVCVTPATLQGYVANYFHFESKRVTKAENPAHRPLFLKGKPLTPEDRRSAQRLSRRPRVRRDSASSTATAFSGSAFSEGPLGFPLAPPPGF